MLQLFPYQSLFLSHMHASIKRMKCSLSHCWHVKWLFYNPIWMSCNYTALLWICDLQLHDSQSCWSRKWINSFWPIWIQNCAINVLSWYNARITALLFLQASIPDLQYAIIYQTKSGPSSQSMAKFIITVCISIPDVQPMFFGSWSHYNSQAVSAVPSLSVYC